MHGLRSCMITTWPAVAEAMHILARYTGWSGQDCLWQMLTNGAVDPRDVTTSMRIRSRDLMARYTDLPMDLADATLVALADVEQDWLVRTLDDRFRLYRPTGRGSFDILPEA